MKPQLHCSKLVIKKSYVKGYGVFAAEDIVKNSIIEECYALKVHDKNNDLINYFYQAGDVYVLPLGYGSIYNHSFSPNAKYSLDDENNIVVYEAVRDVKKGEEIYINYGANWFNCREIKILPPSLWLRMQFFLGMLLRFSIVLGAVFLLIHYTK